MKTLSKIKLNQFSKNELDQRKMNALKGGCGCTGYGCVACGCGINAQTTMTGDSYVHDYFY